MNTIEQLEVSGSHREVGRNIGLHFGGAIHVYSTTMIFCKNNFHRKFR
jgi:hypothetical protein